MFVRDTTVVSESMHAVPDPVIASCDAKRAASSLVLAGSAAQRVGLFSSTRVIELVRLSPLFAALRPAPHPGHEQFQP